jgi:hypothetical protein
MRTLVVIILSVLGAMPMGGQSRRMCRNNPELVGSCFKIHGRVRIVNGGPQMRMWRIGTNRILGVIPSEDEMVPDNLGDALETGTYVDVYGDFEVCPFTESKPNEMQMVCVESATHLVVKKNPD